MLHYSKVACILTNRQQKQQRTIAKDIVQFRQQYQQRSSQREYDLNDPERCKNTNPEDTQMIIPGLVGEDPNSKSRLQRQREQLRDWLIQQQMEHASQKQRQKTEEQNYDQFMVDVNNQALHLQSLEMEKRKAAVVATKDFNLTLSEEKHRQELERHMNDNPTESLNSMEGQLTGVDTSQSIVGIPEDKREVLELKEFQKQQIEEKRRQELSEKTQKCYYDRVRVDSARAAILIERQQAKLNKQLRKHLDGTNLKLAERRKELKPDIARGAINESFFSQFNTCSR